MSDEQKFEAFKGRMVTHNEEVYGAEIRVMDQRFTAYYDKQVPGCARFLRDAVIHWVK